MSLKTTITRAEYLQLLGLKIMADRHLSELDHLVDAAKSIVGEEDKFAHMGDLMFTESMAVDESLRKLEIKVLPDPPKPAISEGWEVEPIVLDQGGENERQGYLLVRDTGGGREEIPLECAAAPIVEALLKAVAPSTPPEDLRAD